MAMNMLTDTEKNIKLLRTDTKYHNTLSSTMKYAKENDFNFELTCYVSTRRHRRVPCKYDEMSKDEVIDDPIQAYKVTIYFVILDTILSEL